MKRKILVFSALAVLVLAVGFFTVHNSEEVDFSSDVKPILNKHCISCHGGVKKNGELSFLFEEEAFANAKSGEPAIIRGDAEHSNMIKRLTEEDPELRMPYNAPKLDDSEIEILRSEEHTSELQSRENLVCRLLLE